MKRRTSLFTGIAILLFMFAWTPIAAYARTISAGTSLGEQIITSAKQYIGTPYQYGAAPDQTASFDCSSFTKRAFADYGITLPRTSGEQYKLGTAVSLSQAQPGDLVFFQDPANPGVPDHVGIYEGNSQMLNATVHHGVISVDLSTSYWTTRFIGVKQVLPQTYTVQSGDMLWKISLKTKDSVSQLEQWNDLSNAMIMPGQLLYTSNPDLTESNPVNAQSASYIVQSGDVLWKISMYTGVSIADLASWNQLQDYQIDVGQRLRLTPPTISYTVQSGDTLWLISQRFGTTVDRIKQLNNLTSDYLWIGQLLKLPAQ